jgi:hypothetical protein
MSVGKECCNFTNYEAEDLRGNVSDEAEESASFNHSFICLLKDYFIFPQLSPFLITSNSLL